eukprot:TRINITY_DN846_c0_g1_i2.p1 TRINITY_DN846_c0_g1~~TRINITY_DN846_c0_g1_i2.p1  ORF type:complete len:384 (-),score=80.24 TRINITY_DN846_c0_g1_i2:82-1233(-)
MFSWFRSSKENETTPMDVCVDDVPPLNEGGSLDCVDIGNHLPSNRRSRDPSSSMDGSRPNARSSLFSSTLNMKNSSSSSSSSSFYDDDLFEEDERDDAIVEDGDRRSGGGNTPARRRGRRRRGRGDGGRVHEEPYGATEEEGDNDDSPDEDQGLNGEETTQRPNRRRYSNRKTSTVSATGSGAATGPYDEGYEVPSQDRSLGLHLLLPYVVSGYLQLIMNVVIVVALGYLMYQLVATVRSDVDIKVEEYSQEIINEIDLCRTQYIANKCLPSDRIPAMQSQCAAWETCMNRDPSVVGRAKISAETLAEIINGFVERISYKTMIFFGALVIGFTLVSNMAFRMARLQVSDPPAIASNHGRRHHPARLSLAGQHPHSYPSLNDGR